jgi:hypothetical protein
MNPKNYSQNYTRDFISQKKTKYWNWRFFQIHELIRPYIPMLIQNGMYLNPNKKNKSSNILNE